MNDALGELGLVPNGLVRMFLFGNQVHDQTNKCSEKRNIKQEKMCGLLTLKRLNSISEITAVNPDTGRDTEMYPIEFKIKNPTPITSA